MRDKTSTKSIDRSMNSSDKQGFAALIVFILFFSGLIALDNYAIDKKARTASIEIYDDIYYFGNISDPNNNAIHVWELDYDISIFFGKKIDFKLVYFTSFGISNLTSITMVIYHNIVDAELILEHSTAIQINQWDFTQGNYSPGFNYTKSGFSYAFEFIGNVNVTEGLIEGVLK